MRAIAGTILSAALCLTGCAKTHEDRNSNPDIVGAWVVSIPGAPFPLHMFVFHSDGTVEQSNPDAGDPKASDSNLMGGWRSDGGGYRGKLVEITADRTTRQLASRGEITFALRVSGNTFDGTASAIFIDATGRQTSGPVQVKMAGERVVP